PCYPSTANIVAHKGDQALRRKFPYPMIRTWIQWTFVTTVGLAVEMFWIFTSPARQDRVTWLLGAVVLAFLVAIPQWATVLSQVLRGGIWWILATIGGWTLG